MKDKIIFQCECKKPYPNPDHGDTCSNCGEEILEMADKKLEDYYES
jgi:hypothetical protein